MVEQSVRLTRYIRAFALFVLLAGIIAMHIAVFGMSHGSGHAMNSMATTAAVHDAPATAAAAHTADHGSHATAAPASTTGVHALAAAPIRAVLTPGCECGDGHAGAHGCVFVLAALLLALGLALLGWGGLRDRETAAAQARRLRTHRARPPPWTVLTLAELAILRV
ncbi:hypothetical protein [Nocardia crassostreae]|uniref:hypothetical protein n=1 Tax=Nocardia crassostreae TaxID=53428 RepID=UPI0008373A2F|nr:hypothetical protein [Nocardia crassostreae]